ncbi:COX15/CtaA family protein [Ramlibacter tataouinensis]|uniref:Cytochrome AA3 controlling protein, membrane protein-like protein n=1 Tax=Ramlibacter tataouinensis (strain ATCC BAA-407 / DSM 14655 / LMG 21543 / TTB310) TaxID=365046 RepID=F5XZC3_RAMTT|nr:cytochrome AA3 controlling protein, membrane protein-like protein [Ramlibacter tataouinensis TTB310]
MDAQPLYDLSPALQLMALGVVVALGPLAWVWLRNRQASAARRLSALTLLTLFLTFDLVLFGAFTRLTDSGLGCPDWPGCYGQASPLGARAEITQAQAAMPTGPVTHGKAWIEMIHRYLASGVGVLILTLAAATWWLRRRGTGEQAAVLNPWWPTATLVWVCLQGAFGALTVTMKLFPAIVTLHLLGGLVLLALLCRQAVSYAQAKDGRAPLALPPALRAGLAAGFALLWLQIALGGWVSTNYAVLACAEFPACQGQWWPPMDFRQGFELWRELGKSGSGEHISFAALTAIHYAHRLAAYLVLAVLALLAWRLHGAGLRHQARWMAGLAALQLATGLSNVVLGWPLLAAVGHTGGAAALVVVFTWAWCESASSPLPLGEGGVRARGARPYPEGEGVRP